MSAPAARSTSALTWLLVVPCVLVPLAISALMVYLAYSIRHVTFELSEQGLRIRGDLFGRLIPRTSLRIKDAALVNLKQEKSHRPFLRTMGVGLPGYSSGWFRLRDGGKGLLFLTDPSRAVYLPTTDNYALLFSPADPERFLVAVEATSVLA